MGTTHKIHSEKSINAGVMMVNSSQRMKEWQVPGSDLFQYGQAIAKPAERLKTEYWQVRIIYKRTVKVGLLKKETVIPFEFASPMICRTHDEAVGYAPHYIYELIKAGDLPKDVILFGNEIDYDKIDKVRGMDICFVTTAKTDEEARELLTLMGAPFSK